LLIDWRWGERYFAEKLLDYELSSNNGNWQWAAGTGCDAAPYFRIFNPETQQKKHDKDCLYITTWIPDYRQDRYIEKIVNHADARERTIKAYKNALKV
jgi:deoxyribodipyrimidine photo-lyase